MPNSTLVSLLFPMYHLLKSASRTTRPSLVPRTSTRLSTVVQRSAIAHRSFSVDKKDGAKEVVETEAVTPNLEELLSKLPPLGQTGGKLNLDSLKGAAPPPKVEPEVVINEKAVGKRSSTANLLDLLLVSSCFVAV